jgi:hypothetical protein
MYTSRISEEKAVSCIEMGPSPFSTVTLAIPSHRSNARAPIEVTDPGRVTSVSDEQPRYVDIIGYQLFVVNTVEKWMCFLLAYGRKTRFNVFNLILQEKCEFEVAK